MVRTTRREPDPPPGERRATPLGEWVCLALVACGASHGWAVVKELEPAAAVGSIWSLTPQLTYRSIEQLTRRGLIERIGSQPGRGPAKVLLQTTPDGRAALGAWLDRPVAHVRDVRTECLLKLLLRQRLNLDNRAFVDAQQAALRPIIERHMTASASAEDPAGLLRREHARAVQRFLTDYRALLDAAQPARD